MADVSAELAQTLEGVTMLVAKGLVQRWIALVSNGLDSATVAATGETIDYHGYAALAPSASVAATGQCSIAGSLTKTLTGGVAAAAGKGPGWDRCSLSKTLASATVAGTATTAHGASVFAGVETVTTASAGVPRSHY